MHYVQEAIHDGGMHNEKIHIKVHYFLQVFLQDAQLPLKDVQVLEQVQMFLEELLGDFQESNRYHHPK